MESNLIRNTLPLLLVFLFLSCGRIDTITGATTKTPEKTEIRKSTEKGDRTLSTSFNASGIALYKKLAANGKKADENIVVSPFSVGMAMTMVLSGASGETAKEMAKVLENTLSKEGMDKAAGTLTDRINALNGQDTEISTANALCLCEDGKTLSDSYKNVLKRDYRAEMFSSPVVGPINAWVAKRTRGKIETILDSLPPNCVCVILNAVYFKGKWLREFDSKRTRPAPFHLTAAKKVKIPMMTQTKRFALAKGDGFRAISLPYKGGKLAMVVLLPDKLDGLGDVTEKLSDANVSKLLDDLEKPRAGKETNVAMPKFKIEYGAGLIPAFKQLGMRLPFSSKDADFGGMLGKKSALGAVWIADIQHKAFIEVDEKGTEAAAATAVVMQTKSVRMEIEMFSIDHPFLFMIVERKTKSILFMGRYLGPPSAKR